MNHIFELISTCYLIHLPVHATPFVQISFDVSPPLFRRRSNSCAKLSFPSYLDLKTWGPAVSDDLRAILSLFHFRATFGPTLNLDNVVCHDASWHRPACALNTHAAESYSFRREPFGKKHTSQMAHLRIICIFLYFRSNPFSFMPPARESA